MFSCEHGNFEGRQWEDLMQLVFKRKFAADGYQCITTSPGDYGLEGFTTLTGKGFQCYCPEKNYSQKEFYEHQRNKINIDLKKLVKNKKELSAILGENKIINWIFVTPVISHNNLLSYIKEKEEEVKGYSLDFIHKDFSISIHDAGYYITEMNDIRYFKGEAISFDLPPPILNDVDIDETQYNGNIKRKSALRLSQLEGSASYERKLRFLEESTTQDFLSHTEFFGKIEKEAPVVYAKLSRVIHEFTEYAARQSNIWTGSAHELTEKLSDSLVETIVNDLGPLITKSTAMTAARHTVARWLAICELDYE
ncbi:hypothetical protein HA48_19525 [Pantoea wallisii]|uniref:Uncharacterized protein n=2 Tax=Pantoea wallisii TaxID=1076551 RepID=A0A1X1CXS0_9GAMM|nr:hypothetical protein HA48_19525 [Pantoea wallisii]